MEAESHFKKLGTGDKQRRGAVRTYPGMSSVGDGSSREADAASQREQGTGALPGDGSCWEEVITREGVLNKDLPRDELVHELQVSILPRRSARVVVRSDALRGLSEAFLLGLRRFVLVYYQGPLA